MNKKNIITFGILFILLIIYINNKSLLIDFISPIIQIVGSKGILLSVAIVVFFHSYKNSVKLFDWIEDQTYGTRDYILKKCELLFIEIEPNKVTYILLFLTFGSAVIMICFFALLGAFKTGIVFGVIAAIIGWKIPRPLINFMVEQRIKKLETQIVDALNLLANGMRAGRGLQQSMSMVVEELPPPVSQEFNLILQQTKIGVPINEAFDNFAARVPTDDTNMFVSSINILKETGGNLAEVFDTIIVIIRERIRLKQKIATYVSQGMAQAGIMFFMPFAMALFFGASDPTFYDKMSTPVGIIMAIVALIFDCIGFAVIYKIINIRV